MKRIDWSAYAGKRVLLLQGPLGPFFKRLAESLTDAGAQVHKVNFNGGDFLFYPTGACAWTGKMTDWPAYLEALLDRLNIDVIMLFGDCRPIHSAAREIANRRAIKVGVFEEGYIRPNYITFEQFGVNGFSLLGRDPQVLRNMPKVARSPETQVGNTFWYAATWAVLYYLAADVLRPFFRHYRHHRPLCVTEALPWLRAAARKWHYARKERGLLRALTGPLSKRFFLVPLQIATDSQILQHSEFSSVAEFIRETVESFACHAPKDTLLVIKHHPLDRGYHDYAAVIREQALKFGLGGRLMYIHDQHLPTLFDHMRGAIVINSTVGFSALSHNAAVKTCGVAIYDLEGLTFQAPLAQFWQEAQSFRPDRDLVERFRGYVIDETQINASFYKGDILAGACTSMASPVHRPEALPVAAPLGAIGAAR
jgi:capsular polysaccharide export protein